MSAKLTKTVFFLFFGLFISGAVAAEEQAPAAAANSCPQILNHQLENLQGKVVNLCDYSGKVILIVNTASECGFTPQYKGLEEIYNRFKSRDFVVLGFPSNDFGEQEPLGNSEIGTFCRRNYGVSFPMFAKSEVKGGKGNALYADLIKTTGHQPKWNFHKYLISRDGSVVKSFGSMTDPTNQKFTIEIEKLLSAHLKN